VNLFSYLADQLLRGCHSADDLVQALQNQAIEDFSVHGSRLPEQEAEVVQIQLLRISLRYLILVDQQDLVLGGFLFLSFEPLADFSLFSYCFGFYKFFVCRYYYSVYPCASETLRGSNCCVVFLITLVYPLSLCDKKGE
jgi:hypothetical protein